MRCQDPMDPSRGVPAVIAVAAFPIFFGGKMWRWREIIKRQDFLYSNVPTCISCGADQVQIISGTTEKPAVWRCRKCRVVFAFEPEEMKQAPWTADEVVALNRHQQKGHLHPFTCPYQHGGERVLVATEVGWVCPECDYTQDWAHAFMFEDR